MALRGKKPVEVEKRLKFFLYGPAGSGKTTLALQFPKPYFIDTERGAENPQYVTLLEKSGGAYYGTQDFDEIAQEVLALLTTDHEYRTLVIDPVTIVWNDLLDECAHKVGTDFGRHYGEANRRMKRLLNLLLRLDMNVIITAHSKNEYGENFVVLGQTFDGYKKLDYLFDLVVEVQKRKEERVGVVKKTRLASFPETEVFPFDYSEFAKRYGAETIERKSEAIDLATDKQVAEIRRLVDLLQVPDATLKKWLTKANAETFAEMPRDAADKIVKHLQAKIKGKE